MGDSGRRAPAAWAAPMRWTLYANSLWYDSRIRVTHNLKSASRALARLDSYPARDAIECPAMGAGCSDMPTLH